MSKKATCCTAWSSAMEISVNMVDQNKFTKHFPSKSCLSQQIYCGALCVLRVKCSFIYTVGFCTKHLPILEPSQNSMYHDKNVISWYTNFRLLHSSLYYLYSTCYGEHILCCLTWYTGVIWCYKYTNIVS